MLLQICIHLNYVEEWNKLNWIELNCNVVAFLAAHFPIDSIVLNNSTQLLDHSNELVPTRNDE